MIQPWDVWQCAFPWGEHPAVVISNAFRCERKQKIVVLACTSMRPDSYREPDNLEALLDQADGLDWKTLCFCELPYTVDKSILKFRKGEVSQARRRDIGQKIIRSLALIGI